MPGCLQGQEGKGCRTPFNLRWHFGYRHPADEVIVNGECLPRCQLCGIQVAWSVVGTPAHKGSKTCERMAAQRAQHKVAAACARAAAQRFTAYGKDDLRNVLRFKYLGHVLSHDDNNIPAMRRNLKRARATWVRVSKILTR